MECWPTWWESPYPVTVQVVFSMVFHTLGPRWLNAGGRRKFKGTVMLYSRVFFLTRRVFLSTFPSRWILWPNHQLTDHQAARNIPSILILHGVNRNFGLRPSVPGRWQEVGVFDPGRPAQRHPAWGPGQWLRFTEVMAVSEVMVPQNHPVIRIIRPFSRIENHGFLEIREFENPPYGIILLQVPNRFNVLGNTAQLLSAEFLERVFMCQERRKVFMRYTCLTHTVVQ